MHMDVADLAFHMALSDIANQSAIISMFPVVLIPHDQDMKVQVRHNNRQAGIEYSIPGR